MTESASRSSREFPRRGASRRASHGYILRRRLRTCHAVAIGPMLISAAALPKPSALPLLGGIAPEGFAGESTALWLALQFTQQRCVP